MKTIKNEMSSLQTLLELLRNQFGVESEFILHDWSKGYSHSVVVTENGHITNYKIEDCGSNLGLEVIHGTTTSDMKYNYVTHARKGKALLSSTMYIKNDDGQALGVLCINTDISERIEIKEYLDSSFPEELDKKDGNEEFFAADVSDLLVYLIDQGIGSVGGPAGKMTREGRMKVLRFLGGRGAFLINKSGTKTC